MEFPEQRPPGLRLASTSPVWWRIDTVRPEDWGWDGFSHPRHRFDPPSGRFRVRYAANDPVAAACERFPARRIPPAAGDLRLVRLEQPGSALHLTHQANLDVLGLDDRVSTGRLLEPGEPGEPRADQLLAVAQRLSDAVFEWWEGRPPPIVYRARTLPSARSMAFTRWCAWESVAWDFLSEATTLLVRLVTHHGFDVPDAWLDRRPRRRP